MVDHRRCARSIEAVGGRWLVRYQIQSPVGVCHANLRSGICPRSSRVQHKNIVFRPLCATFTVLMGRSSRTRCLVTHHSQLALVEARRSRERRANATPNCGETARRQPSWCVRSALRLSGSGRLVDGHGDAVAATACGPQPRLVGLGTRQLRDGEVGSGGRTRRQTAARLHGGSLLDVLASDEH